MYAIWKSQNTISHFVLTHKSQQLFRPNSNQEHFMSLEDDHSVSTREYILDMGHEYGRLI